VTHAAYWLQLAEASERAAEPPVPEGFADSWLPPPCAGDALERAIAALYVRGGQFDWQALFPVAAQPATMLPNYPFERQRFSLEKIQSPAVGMDAGSIDAAVRHLKASGKYPDDVLNAFPSWSAPRSHRPPTKPSPRPRRRSITSHGSSTSRHRLRARPCPHRRG
jgi:acyl transferase domain-containing protein